MGEPKDGMTLDRINNNEGYNPDNCRWVSRLIQGRNKRNNTLLTCRGRTLTMSQWVEYTGVNHTTMRRRLNKGWSTERAIFTATRSIKMNFKPMGQRILLSVAQESMQGGIIIPAEVESLDQRYATVVALPEDESINSQLKIGDKVMCEDIGVDVDLDGKNYKLVHIEYIQGLIS
jgi:co-chaperonin GroES (HSP10)